MIQQQDIMRALSADFDFFRIPIPEDRVNTFYYDNVINEILYGVTPDSLSETEFLNDVASKNLPQNLSLSGMPSAAEHLEITMIIF